MATETIMLDQVTSQGSGMKFSNRDYKPTGSNQHSQTSVKNGAVTAVTWQTAEAQALMIKNPA